MENEFPKDLVAFTRRFETEEACLAYLATARWPGGFVCPACGGSKGWSMSRGTLWCAACGRQTSPQAGTVLHRSHIPVRSWFLGMWLACTQKTGLSAKGLQRELGLGSYRTAWLMLQKLRRAMVRMGRDKLVGSIEADETYLGSAEKGVRGRKLVDKALVAIAVELDGRKVGRIRLRHVPDGSFKSLGGFLVDSVAPGSPIHTDGWVGHDGLTAVGFSHRVTHTAGDDSLAVEIFPHVHLVASLLKRWLGATHQGRVGHRHLQGYLDEFAFRFNRRRSQHIGKVFHRLLEQLVIRQASTYKEIVGSQEPSA
jgi:transposase-like protein